MRSRRTGSAGGGRAPEGEQASTHTVGAGGGIRFKALCGSRCYFTITLPTIFGWIEQKYVYTPGLANVKL